MHVRLVFLLCFDADGLFVQMIKKMEHILKQTYHIVLYIAAWPTHVTPVCVWEGPPKSKINVWRAALILWWAATSNKKCIENPAAYCCRPQQWTLLPQRKLTVAFRKR